MLQKIAVTLLSLLLLVIFAFGFTLWYANTENGRQFISEQATQTLDRRVRYTGSIGLTADLPLTFRIKGLQIDNMKGGRADTMVDIGQAEASIRLLPLLIGKVSLPFIRLQDSEVYIERTAEKANWQFGEPEPEEADDGNTRLSIGRLELRDSIFGYFDVPQSIDLKVTAETENDQIVVSGDGTYLGKPFKLDITGGELLSARTKTPYPIDAKVVVGYTTIEAKGTIQDPIHFAGLDVQLHLKGADAAELFPLFGIALPPTPPYDIEGQLTFASDVWSFNDFAGTMGKSDIGGDVKWDKSRTRPKLTADFISQKIDLVDLGPLIGLAPREPESTLQKVFSQKREQSPTLIPDVPLDIERVAAMDADVTYKGVQVISPYLPLDDFMLTVNLDNRLLKIQPVKFGTADGDVIANMTVNARETPVRIDSDVQFSRLSLERLTESINTTIPMTEKSVGMIGGTAKLSGYGKSLKDMLSTSNGNVGVGMEGGQISNLLVEIIGLDIAQGLGFVLTGDEVVPVRCIIGDFAVKDGIMNSRAVVIDTTDTNIQGQGTIDLNSEKINLRMVPKPKDATLAALRVPLRVEGTLKNPEFVVEKGALLAKTAGAVALGVLLTPAASILALVEGGFGKDSNCAALVSNMRNNTDTNATTDNVPSNANAPVDEPSNTPAENDPSNGEPVAPEKPAEDEAIAPSSNTKPSMQDDIATHPGEADVIER